MDEQPLQEYVWAIGTAILALNEAESKIFSLLQQLIEGEQSELPEQELEATMSRLEANVFSDKINRIEEIANRRNPAVRTGQSRSSQRVAARRRARQLRPADA